jgi:hypothetical protein
MNQHIVLQPLDLTRDIVTLNQNQPACGENTPAEELCRDEADMPPNEDTGAKEEEEQDEQDSDDGLSDWVAPTDDETEQEEEFDNDVEPEEEEEESEESEAETSEDEGGE